MAHKLFAFPKPQPESLEFRRSLSAGQRERSRCYSSGIHQVIVLFGRQVRFGRIPERERDKMVAALPLSLSLSSPKQPLKGSSTMAQQWVINWQHRVNLELLRQFLSYPLRQPKVIGGEQTFTFSRPFLSWAAAYKRLLQV